MELVEESAVLMEESELKERPLRAQERESAQEQEPKWVQALGWAQKQVLGLELESVQVPALEQVRVLAQESE